MREPVEIAFPAKPEYVSVARLVVAAVAQSHLFDPEEVEDIKIAVSEACSSAILRIHQDLKPEERLVKVSAWRTANQFLIDVSYPGEAVDASGIQSAPVVAEDDFGLSILTGLMDKVELLRGKAGSSLRLVKSLPRTATIR